MLVEGALDASVGCRIKVNSSHGSCESWKRMFVKSSFSSLIRIPEGGRLLADGDMVVGITISSFYGPREVCWIFIRGDWTLFSSMRYCLRAETRLRSWFKGKLCGIIFHLETWSWVQKSLITRC